MKPHPTIILLCLALVLSSCAAPSDSAFMTNASAAINGGFIATPTGALMRSEGQHPENHPHPFFGTP